MKKYILSAASLLVIGGLLIGVGSVSASNYRILIQQAAGLGDGVNQAGIGISIYNGTDYVKDDFILFDFTGIDSSLEFHDVVNAAIMDYGETNSLGLSENDIIWGYMPNNVTPTEYWHNGETQVSYKHMTFSGTTTSGSKVFYLTDDGTVNGNALCSSAPRHIDVSANDPGNTFGLGYVVSNSNKTMTITANVRTFTSIPLLGQSVLISTSLTAAPNGTAVSAAVDCNL